MPTKSSPKQAAPAASPQKTSHKASITGSILAVASLAFAGIANAVVRAEYMPNGPTSGSVDREVGNAIATGTTSALGAIFGMMFIVCAIVLALAALAFIVIRLRKVKLGGWVFSIVAGALAVWSLAISIGAFDVIKAN